MLSHQDRAIAEAFKQRLLEAGVPLHSFRVFGSRARGENTIESDLDVCLLLNVLDDEVERTVSRIAWEVGYQFGRIITTVEFLHGQLESSPLCASPFVQAIQREGIPI